MINYSLLKIKHLMIYMNGKLINNNNRIIKKFNNF